jgi:quercetin dioxygenase-like cupin family protein
MPTETQPAELDFLGARARILATGGELGLVEMLEVPAGDQPPLHVHHTHDELFFVVSGELTLYTPGEERVLRAGDFVLAPRGVPHAYRVSGDGPVHMLTGSTPAGFERFVAAVAALDAVEPETLTAVAAEHDIEILGPPGARP